MHALYSLFVKQPAGRALAKRLCNDQTRAHLFICDHIGDFLVAMGYLDAFKAAHHLPAVTVYVSPKMVPLAERYLGEDDRAEALAPLKLKWVLSLNGSRKTADWVAERGNIWLVEPGANITDGRFRFFLDFPGTTLRHLIQFGCLHLPEDAAFRMLPLPDEGQDTPAKKKSVLLCPQAQLAWWLKPIPASFFDKLAEQLVRDGKYDVYVNIGPGDSESAAYPGTIPLRMTLEEVGNWIGAEDTVIGLRSGLMDFLAFYPCRILSLYPEGSPYNCFFSLDMLPETRCRYSELFLTGDCDRDLQAVLQELAQEEKPCNPEKR